MLFLLLTYKNRLAGVPLREVMMASIIVYYSLEGSTDLAARSIAGRTGADLVRLVPEKEVPKKGFGKYFLGGKSALFSERPRLTNRRIDFTKYDTVIIGSPVWAGTVTPPILSFLAIQPFSGKKVFLFASHSGGGAEKCFAKIEGKLTGNTLIGTAEFLEPVKNEAEIKSEKISAFCDAILKE